MDLIGRSFSDQLGDLCRAATSRAAHDPDAMSEIVERLASALGLTIAIACQGDRRAMDVMLTGTEAYVADEALRYQPVGTALAATLRAKGE
jgi:hypothetical protein